MRLRWFLTMTTILAATVGLTVLVSEGIGRVGTGGGEGSDQVVGGPGRSTTTTAPDVTSSSELPPASVQVTGTITALHLEGAVPEPRSVTTPLTIVADRGMGNGGRVADVLVDGTPATIEWDAGRPFVLSSGGAVVLDPVRMDLTPEGVRLNLADGVHALTPGTYHLDTPVAVGSSGMAGARESVVFDAVDTTTLELRGDAAIWLDAGAARRLLGPGVVHLEGQLEVHDAAGTRAVTRLDATAGAFDLTLTPVAGGGWTIDGRLGGQVTTA